MLTNVLFDLVVMLLSFLVGSTASHAVPIGSFHFTRLSQLQIEDRGTVDFRANGMFEGFKIAPLILVVFIENAFKHSQASQSENIHIEIDIQLTEGGRLEFRCKNNFLPDPNTESLSKGIGLKNVRKRLNLLYPQAHELSIQESDGVYDVRLSMQLTKAYSI